MSGEVSTPAGWVYPTSTATRAHWFGSGEFRSGCGKYGRLKSDHGWRTSNGSTPKDACLPCERKRVKEATR